MLIIPEESWCHWNLTSEAMHGISRKILFEKGKAAMVVAKELNAALANVSVGNPSSFRRIEAASIGWL